MTVKTEAALTLLVDIVVYFLDIRNRQLQLSCSYLHTRTCFVLPVQPENIGNLKMIIDKPKNNEPKDKEPDDDKRKDDKRVGVCSCEL